MQRIGVLGGTFDPIHYGHLAIAAEVHWALGLTTVYLVPAAHQPLKDTQPRASAQQRLEMVRRACADNAALVASDIELHRPPPSYTVDTLTDLRQQLGVQAELWFILGADALNSLPRWHRIGDLLHVARLVAVKRPGTAPDREALEQTVPGLRDRLVLLEGPNLEISSSLLRERIAAGRPVRYQLPDSVLAYIQQQQLYGSSAATSE
ncbi:MAG: nicotinate-nucleotide adenylyltransferase [Chloroflexaceae bacterium]|nr:nicotinate-nucleotide adenylyltransferase [Chloroflexaceae bacterium]NJO05555.1 nicotinate-nucleotide adenylyltransferase [Chloroflexaceae bacterium]